MIVSAAMSVDGYLDDASPERLLLSNEADFDRVDDLRAACDAILVGAETRAIGDVVLLRYRLGSGPWGTDRWGPADGE